MKLTDETGQLWEFRGEYRAPLKGDYYVPPGENVPIQATRNHEDNYNFAIIHPIHPCHKFGGVVFGETGVFHYPDDEWFVRDGQIGFAGLGSGRVEIIVRPVRLEAP